MIASATAVEPRPIAPSGNGHASGRKLKVAYVVSRFPKLTETFVLYEILALEQQGITVEIFPLLGADAAATRQGASFFEKIAELFRPRKKAMVQKEAEPLVKRAHYRPFFSWSILCANVRSMFRSPGTYFGSLGALIRGAWGSKNYLLGGLATFPKVVSFAEQMRKDGVQYIHAHFANHPAAAAFLIHRLSGIPYSFTAHGSDLHCDQHMLLEKVRDADRVISISEYNRRFIAEACGPEVLEKIEIVRCGVDTSVFRGRERAALTSPDGRFRILSIGTLHEVKGQAYLIDAVRLLKDRGIDCLCRIVGDGPDREALQRQIEAAGLTENVQLLGARTRSEIAELLRESDAFAAPSVPTSSGRREGIPVVLMEAMASEVPCVASDLSGIPELVEDGVTGLLAAPRDAAQLADALARLQSEPEVARALARAGRERVLDDFDVHRNAARLARDFAERSRRHDS